MFRSNRRYRVVDFLIDGGWYLLMCSVICLHSIVPARAQCPDVLTKSPQDAWEQNAKLTVDIDPSYTPTERECIKKGLQSWQKSNTGAANHSASGVVINKYTYGESTNNHNTLIIQKAPPGVNNDIAQTSPVPGANGKLDYAITQVNRNVTNCDALAEMAAHEFGHTLGLTGHCTAQTGCNSPTASIMTTAAPGAYDASGNLVNPNAIKGTAGSPLMPTACDNTRAKEAGQYNPSTANPPAPAPPAAGGGGGTSPRPQDYYDHHPVCYMAVQVTTYWQCFGCGGCYYAGTNYSFLGINCY